MKSYMPSTLLIGIFLPMCLTVGVVSGCAGFAFRLQAWAQAKEYTAQALEAYGPRLKLMQKEKIFLKESWPEQAPAPPDVRLTLFLQNIQARAQADAGLAVAISEAGTQHHVYGPRAASAILELQGLSGQILPLLGETLHDSPGIFIDSWKISMNAEQNRLLISLVVVAPSLSSQKP